LESIVLDRRLQFAVELTKELNNMFGVETKLSMSFHPQMGEKTECMSQNVTNFIQLVSPQPVDQFSQTKLCWKALNEGYMHICGMYKSDNKKLRYQAISN